jgi:hypothetical protein
MIKNGSKTEKAVLHMYTKYHEAVKCYSNFLPLTIDVENLTKSVNRKWISNRPEMVSHNMGPYVNAVNHISRGCGN